MQELPLEHPADLGTDNTTTNNTRSKHTTTTTNNNNNSTTHILLIWQCLKMEMKELPLEHPADLG